MERFVVRNPYENVDWNTIQRHKANFHSHTVESGDAQLKPHELVDAYHQRGYSILAITEHDFVNQTDATYPWTEFSKFNAEYENRDPEQLGMLAIIGNELSRPKHINSLFVNHNTEPQTERQALLEMEQMGALGFCNHPMMYTDDEGWRIYNQYYAQTSFKNLPAIEVYNSRNERNRYINEPDGRKAKTMWHNMLMRLLPDRPVWGVANDDCHGIPFPSMNLMLLNNFTVENVRSALEDGEFFFQFKTKEEAPDFPEINSLTVSGETITIDAEGYDTLEWISDGKVISTNTSIDFEEVEGIYVTAELKKSGDGDAYIGTQPIIFNKRLVNPFKTRRRSNVTNYRPLSGWF